MSNRLTRAYRRSDGFDIDALGREIELWGRTGLNMPPAYAGCGMTIAMKGPDGEHIGHLLPGKGAYVDLDLKALGFRRMPANIFHRPMLQRATAWIDRWAHRIITHSGLIPDPLAAALWLKGREPFLAGREGAITSYGGIINARAGGFMNDVWIGKASFTTTATDWYAGSRATGTPGAMTLLATTAPTAAATTRATTGAWSTGIFNPTGSNKKYLLTFGLNAAQQINFGYLVDIHTQQGAFRLTVGTAETVASPVTIVRNYYPGGGLGSGCWAIGQTTTGASATATNLTYTYVDQDGNTGITAVVAGPATATIADQLWPDSSAATGASPFWVLASGDHGLRQVSSTTSSVSLVAGQINIQVVTPLVAMPGVAAGAYLERDSTVQVDGLVELVTDSGVIGCLSLIMLTNTTSTGVLSAFMRTTEG